MAIDYLEAAVEIAREAGAVLREEAQKTPDISYKGDYDLGTQADKRAGGVVVRRLQEDFSGHAGAGEEGTGEETGAGYERAVGPQGGETDVVDSDPCCC